MIGGAPWNAAWTGETRFEVRPCRYAEGRRAVWQPFAPGEGKPIFASPHFVRQRRSIAELRCTVCGERTAEDDRWWFGLGEERVAVFMTAEAPVHRACADLALRMCPHLRSRGCPPQRLPGGHFVAAQMIGGPVVARDFGLDLQGVFVGHLKLCWRRDDWRLVAARRLFAAQRPEAGSDPIAPGRLS